MICYHVVLCNNRLVGERRRPPYRWFLVGPERSGTCVHIDPLGTSAWNTLIRGIKRWVLFPPGTPKHVVKGTEVVIKGEDDEATNYFIDILPRIKHKYADGFTKPSHTSIATAATTKSNSATTVAVTPRGLKVLEFIQYEGDTVFVPGGVYCSRLLYVHLSRMIHMTCVLLE